VRKVKQFFESKGIKASGAIMAYLGAPGDGIRSFCWTNPEQRERFRKIVASTAGIFDEIIFDDLFMFNCRCELCQRARGNKSWTEYRLEVMKEVGENLVVKNAKSVNPKIQPDLQTAELVRPVSVFRLQPGGPVQGLRHDLCRHRNQGPG